MSLCKPPLYFRLSENTKKIYFLMNYNEKIELKMFIMHNYDKESYKLSMYSDTLFFEWFNSDINRKYFLNNYYSDFCKNWNNNEIKGYYDILTSNTLSFEEIHNVDRKIVKAFLNIYGKKN